MDLVHPTPWSCDMERKVPLVAVQPDFLLIVDARSDPVTTVPIYDSIKDGDEEITDRDTLLTEAKQRAHQIMDAVNERQDNVVRVYDLMSEVEKHIGNCASKHGTNEYNRLRYALLVRVAEFCRDMPGPQFNAAINEGVHE